MVAMAADLSAHRRDEYLQAARLAIAPDHLAIELALTPGIAIADRVIARIDQDADGELSFSEQQAYVRSMLERLHLDVDRRPVPLALTRFRFPEPEAIRHGEGVIVVDADAGNAGLTAGEHRLVFRNGNDADGAAYLANALMPDTDGVLITAQSRTEDQRDLTIDFSLRARSASAATVLVALGALTLVAFPLARRRRASEGR